MAYKMKGSEFYGKMKLNRNMDDSSNPDGRAKSSAFQKEGTGSSPAKGKVWDKLTQIGEGIKGGFHGLGKETGWTSTAGRYPFVDTIEGFKRGYKREKAHDEAAAKKKSSPAKDKNPHTGLNPPHTEENHPKGQLTKNKTVRELVSNLPEDVRKKLVEKRLIKRGKRLIKTKSRSHEMKHE